MRRLALVLTILIPIVCSAATKATGEASAAGTCRLFTEDLCLSGAPARARSAAQALAAATSDGAVLRGLGVPSLSAADGVGQRRKLNGDLINLFTRPFPAQRKTSGHEGAADLSQAPVSETWSLPVKEDRVGAVLGLKQSLGSGIRWARNAQISTSVERCPRMPNPHNTHGAIELWLKGSYGISGIWKEGGAEIERSVLIIIDEFRSGGSVDRDARFSHWQNWQGLEIVMVRAVWVRRPGQKTKFQRYTASFTAKPAANGWKVGSDAFDRWIERTESAEDHELAPPGREGPLINEEAWARLALPFLEMAEATLMRGVAEAERGWRTPNRCAQLQWQPEEDTIALQPGKTREIQGRIVRREGGLDGLSYWNTDPRQYVGRIKQALVSSSGPDRPMRLVVVASKPKGNYTVHFRWRVPSTIGVVQGEWTAKASVLPTRWEGTFSGRSAEPSLPVTWQGTVTLVYDERRSIPENIAYVVEKIKVTVHTVHGAEPWCDFGPRTHTATISGKRGYEAGHMDIWTMKTPGKGHLYKVAVGVYGDEYEYPNLCREDRVDPDDTQRYEPSAGFGTDSYEYTDAKRIKGSNFASHGSGSTWDLKAAD